MTVRTTDLQDGPSHLGGARTLRDCDCGIKGAFSETWEKCISKESTIKDLALITRGLYSFYEKSSGMCRFQLEATPDGPFPVDHAARLLAMHCMVLGQSPSDYVVMISPANDALKGLTEKAEKILEAGHSSKDRIKLTHREEEVLVGIMRSFTNKEIAASLNLSERTIKFHVSSLLAKFQVRDRMELARKATSHSFSDRVKLTRREEEVLAGIMRSFANKEIAASLNLSERTIKFHVSSLLAKFQVRDRMELARKATGHIAGSLSMPLPVATRETPSYAQVPQSYGNRPYALTTSFHWLNDN